MRVYPENQRFENYPTLRPSLGVLPQALVAVALGLALFFVFLIAVVAGYSMWYAGLIYPGVSVAGIDLSAMPPREAAELLAGRLTYTETGKIVFKDGGDYWLARPAEVGLFFDPQTTALAAYSQGRRGNPLARLASQFEAWYFGKDLPPLLVYDERTAQNYLSGIAVQVNIPTVEAGLRLNGVEVVSTPGQIGRTLDISASLAPLQAQMRTLTDGILPLAVYETAPAILDATQEAEVARKILSQPLSLAIPDAQKGDPGPWAYEPARLAELLVIERVEAPEGDHYRIGLKTEGLRPFFEELAPKLERSPSNARFMFNDETRELEVLQPSVTGRSLDVNATLQAISQKLLQGEHAVELTINYTQPGVSDKATAKDLGVIELVHAEISFFRGSGASRMQNIETAAARFHGVMVPPGATFSMAEVLGDVSLDNGYAEALIIFGGRTIKGVGGGVCQVSTTLFRTAFFAGYPVVERHPHAYRVGYYEQNGRGYDPGLAGLDATVFVPVVDFKFTNDTPHWLLMETYTNKSRGTLTWKFYSTSDGRTVEMNTTGPKNIVAPPDPLYEENPDLDRGVIKQVDWAAEGADVVVNRTVYRGGQVLFDDRFVTHYMPWRDIYQYGPGTKLPDGTRGN